LAKILGDEALVQKDSPIASDFGAERIRQIATRWVEFNVGYRSTEAAKFRKYAARLGEQLRIGDASSPQRILAPYFCVSGLEDPWYEKSCELYAATNAAAGESVEVTRVLAAKSVDGLAEIVRDGYTDDVCIWVSNLDEREATAGDLARYAQAIGKLESSGRRSFALYGGCYSVVLSSVGLGGSSHGIGYGEHRDWRELPRSGPPPARYYLPTIHRYAQQDLAQELWNHDPLLVGTDVVEPPVNLGYHELMLHSVHARCEEIETFREMSIVDSIGLLESQNLEFRRRLATSEDRALVRQGNSIAEHLPRWIRSLRVL